MLASEWVRVRLAALVALVLATFAAPAFGQGTTAGRATDQWEPERLRRVIEERYRVVPLRDGVVLVPRRENKDVRSIELSGDAVAINGTPVTGAEVKDRLRSDGDAVLALSYLPPDKRRALFGEALPPTRPERTEGQAAGTQVEAPPPPSPEAAREVAPEGRTPGAERRDVTSRSDAKIHIGGGVEVREGELVDGPVVAVAGSVTVNGEVRQDVVAVAGNVTLGPKARVGGDVTAVGGTIDRDPHAQVEGKINEIGLRMPHIRLGPRFWLPAPGFLGGGLRWAEAMVTLFRMVLFGLLALLVFLLAPNPVARIERAAAAEPWKAGLVGIFTQLLFLPVFLLTIIILTVSIVGIPLLLFVPPLAILAFIAAFFLGFTGVAYGVGRWVEQRFRWTGQSAYVLLLVGLVAIWAVTIAGRFVSIGGWPLWVIASALLIVGFLVEYVAWTVGLGAAVMTRFGTRPAGGNAPMAAPSAVGAGPQAGGTA